MKNALTLLAIGAIILVLALLAIWPPPFVETFQRRQRPEAHQVTANPVKTAVSIDPPLGFHWGDSMAHVEALLGYSAARITARSATGDTETWRVEGLIQPGLKDTRFLFQNNALREVELCCQYDSWSWPQYQARLEELRAFFDAKYHRGEPSQQIVTSERTGPREKRVGYGWRFQNAYVGVFCRSFPSPSGQPPVVNDLVIHYAGAQSRVDRRQLDGTENRWSDEVSSPPLAQKIQRTATEFPAESSFGITNWKLINVSHTGRTAFTLQIDVKLRPAATVDPNKALVNVNFYDVVGEKEIVLTDAKVNYEWRSRRDWKATNPETLTVAYTSDVAELPKPAAGRKLFGYVAAVYYDGKLESVRAEPLKLLNLFPIRTYTSPFEEAQNDVARGDFASAAQLYRRSADEGNLFALENLAWFYAHGKGVERDYHQAAVLYERAALQNTPRALNALAWFLATCPDSTVRNGGEAMGHAVRACELTYWQEWKQIDTLAAACAEVGDFERAMNYEREAMDLAGVDEEARKKMEQHLGLYQQRQPCRD